MQWVLLVIALIMHAGFAFVVGLGVIGYLFPEVLEGWAKRKAERAGLNYEAMVDSPEKYRQVLRRNGLRTILMYVPIWLVFTLLMLWMMR